MITTIATFQIPSSLDHTKASEHFSKVAPKFQDIPGLIRKHFLFSAENNTAGGVYLWEDQKAAEGFINEKLIDMIREEFGVEPNVQYFSTPVVVDNQNQTIINEEIIKQTYVV